MTEMIARSIVEQISVFNRASEVAQKLHRESEASNHTGPSAYYSLGMAAYCMRNYEQAHDLLTRSFAADDNAETAIRIAMTDLRRANFEGSAKWSQTAISISPKGEFVTLISESTVPFFSVLAAAEFGAGRLQAANGAAEAALQILNNDAMAIQVTVLCSIITGDTDRALRIVDQNRYLAEDSHPMSQFVRLAKGAATANSDGVPLHLSGMQTYIPAAAEMANAVF